MKNLKLEPILVTGDGFTEEKLEKVAEQKLRDKGFRGWIKMHWHTRCPYGYVCLMEVNGSLW